LDSGYLLIQAAIPSNVKHTRKVKKIYLGLMKVKGRIGKDETTLKKTRDKLVKITGKVIVDAQAVQAELELELCVVH
jgi:hypothetical protein